MAAIGIQAMYRGLHLMRSMPDDIKEFHDDTGFFVAVDLDGIIWVKWFGDDWAAICEESDRDKLIDYFRSMMQYIPEFRQEDNNG